MAISTILSENSNYYLTVYSNVTHQNVAERYSIVTWTVMVTRSNPGLHSATVGWGSANEIGVSSARHLSRDLYFATNFAYDFRGNNIAQAYRMAQGSFRINHDEDGNASFYVSGYIRLLNLGSASAGLEDQKAPNIGPRSFPPASTTPLSLDQIDQTSMRYRFDGNGNGGSPILEWQVGYGTNPTTPRYFIKSNGTSRLVKLAPATTWYVWSRGRNARGWGPWSRRLSARTTAGAHVKVNGVWKEAVPYVKSAGRWKVARPYVKHNGIWRPGQ